MDTVGAAPFPLCKAAGTWCLTPTPSGAKVKERVEVFLNLHSGRSRPIVGANCSLNLTNVWLLSWKPFTSGSSYVS